MSTDNPTEIRIPLPSPAPTAYPYLHARPYPSRPGQGHFCD